MADKTEDFVALIARMNADILSSREEKRLAIQDHIKPMFLSLLESYPKLDSLQWLNFRLLPVIETGAAQGEIDAISMAVASLQMELQFMTVELNEEIFGSNSFVVTREDLVDEAV